MITGMLFHSLYFPLVASASVGGNPGSNAPSTISITSMNYEGILSVYNYANLSINVHSTNISSGDRTYYAKIECDGYGFMGSGQITIPANQQTSKPDRQK